MAEATNLFVNLSLLSPSVNKVTNSVYLGSISNALLTIVNTDSRGQVAFTSPSYFVNENGGAAIIPLVRTGGSAESITVHYATADNPTVTSGSDYLPADNFLTFGPGELSKTFTVPIIDNSTNNLPRFVSLVLSSSQASDLGSNNTAFLNILDDETINQPPGTGDTDISSDLGFDGNLLALARQPDGKLLAGGEFTSANGMPRNRIARLNPDCSLDIGFSSVSPTAGANDSVLAIAPQSDQRIVLGGNFTTMNGVNRNYLARITPAGFIDSTFNPGSGPDNTVFAIAETFVGSERKLLIGGAFTTFNSLQSPSYPFFARLNDNGSLDSTFAPHPNNKVFAITLQPDGKALIGGDFTSINGVARHHIARLNTDGSLDLAFDPGTGPNDSVRAISVQLDGKILIGGLFTNVTDVTGQTFSRNHIARLDTFGHVDTSFSPGLGANDLVSSISLQSDTRILLGGQFTLCNGVTRNRLTRLNPDGSTDTMINFGTGANSFIAATLVLPDGKILFGGGFTQYRWPARCPPRPHLRRLPCRLGFLRVLPPPNTRPMRLAPTPSSPSAAAGAPATLPPAPTCSSASTPAMAPPSPASTTSPSPPPSLSPPAKSCRASSSP